MSAQQPLPPGPAYIEQRYGRDVARRWSRICRLLITGYLITVLVAGLLLSTYMEAKTAVHLQRLMIGVGAAGLVAVWRMRKSDRNDYGAMPKSLELD